jgi:hypothetical protein
LTSFCKVPVTILFRIIRLCSQSLLTFLHILEFSAT